MHMRLSPIAFSSFALWLLATAVAQAAVVTYPAPQGEALSTEYEVTADGKRVDV